MKKLFTPENLVNLFFKLFWNCVILTALYLGILLLRIPYALTFVSYISTEKVKIEILNDTALTGFNEKMEKLTNRKNCTSKGVAELNYINQRFSREPTTIGFLFKLTDVNEYSYLCDNKDQLNFEISDADYISFNRHAKPYEDKFNIGSYFSGDKLTYRGLLSYVTDVNNHWFMLAGKEKSVIDKQNKQEAESHKNQLKNQSELAKKELLKG